MYLTHTTAQLRGGTTVCRRFFFVFDHPVFRSSTFVAAACASPRLKNVRKLNMLEVQDLFLTYTLCAARETRDAIKTCNLAIR